MGFNNTTNTLSLTAKFTVFGRQQLLAGSSNTITHFALFDDDANYGASLPLSSGEVPNSSGNLGPNNGANTSVAQGYIPKSLLIYDTLGQKKKPVNEGSNIIINNTVLIGQTTISGSSITQDIINKNEYETDSLVNLFYTFRLPITSADESLFTATTANKGGFADTAMSALSQDKILILAVDSTKYGEMLDGKTVRVKLTTTGGTDYILYSTFEKTLTNSKILDASYGDKSRNSSIMGDNIAFLFSDDIQKPNNDSSLSWSTGHFTTKPFSVSRKLQFNMFSDSFTSTVSDKIVGVAYLDKGFIVVTHPDIVNNFDPLTSTGTTISYDSISTQVTQEITCVVGRGEFATSTNKTWSRGDLTRISGVLLLDASDNILAVAKTDRHIVKSAQQFLALGIKISV